MFIIIQKPNNTRYFCEIYETVDYKKVVTVTKNVYTILMLNK